MTRNSHIRHGIGAVRPYLCGPLEVVDFVKHVFGGRELERHAFGPQSFHVEIQIGDSVVVIEAGELPPEVEPWKGTIYVYLEDADGAFERAREAGAEIVSVMRDKPYGERQGGFRDAGGNMWWVARCTAK